MHLRCFFLIGQTLSIIFDMKVADPSRESCLNNISWHLTTSAFVFQLLISEGVELVLMGGRVGKTRCIASFIFDVKEPRKLRCFARSEERRVGKEWRIGVCTA